ncbi:MAG: hypothetical protein KKH40_07670, partial [Nanoarchaeota archaeon]|nr:hypothetical protein [Nanoarchaeota archaeon]
MRSTRLENVKGEEIERLKKEYFKQIDANTPKEIKNNLIFDLDNPKSHKIKLTKKLIEKYELREWLTNYKKEAIVSTGGIRGPQNVLYPWDTRYPMNQLGIALATLGKAFVLKEDLPVDKINKICSGEVRYNTDDYINLITRIQAAQKIKTHLPFNKQKTSIWMTSFLIFMLDYDGGEYVTSSHAISSKIATKDLDNQGSQFIPEMSARFVKKIEEVLDAAENESYNIELESANSPLITEDFDGLEMYFDYLKKGVATDVAINLIKEEADAGLEIMFECVGGCMYPIMSELFNLLGIEKAFVWNNIELDPFFHGIGKVMENPITKNKEFFDYGCDTTMMEVVKTMGYDKLLKDKSEGYIILMVDPDGDRIVVGQVESISRKPKIESLGIQFIEIDDERILTVYTPNQSFFLTMNYQATQLKNAGLWNDHPRFIITTTPSAASWVEWANANDVKVVYVPVGFKEIANMMKKIEKQITDNPDKKVEVVDIFNRKINLGIQPRMLFAGEESGGMIIGPEHLIKSQSGRIAIAMREKSAGEASIILAAMIAQLHRDKKLISDHLESVFDKFHIKRRYDLKREQRFYNESNPNPEQLKKDKASGEIQRDKIDDFYLSISLALREEKITLEQAKKLISEVAPNIDFNNLNNIVFVGDGTYFDFKDKFVELRKSGTDAIIKCYSAGESKQNCIAYANAIIGYDGTITENFKKLIPEEIHGNCKKIALNI